MEVVGYIAILFMGMALGLIGGGGSILTLPILIYLFRFENMTAVTASLFIVGSIAFIGAITNALKNNVDFKIGFIFAIPSFIGVYLTRKLLLPLIPDFMILPFDILLSKGSLTILFFATVMIFSSYAMLKTQKNSQLVSDKNTAWTIFLLKSFFVGCVTGFVGAGGGFLIIPALVLLLHLPMNKAVGTSLAIISANSLLAFAFSNEVDSLNWSTLFKILGLGLLGLFVGQKIAPKIAEKELKGVFAYTVLFIAIYLVVDLII